MRKYLIIILVLIGLSSQAQPYLVQSAKWQFKYGQRFDSAFRVYNLPILTGDTVIGFNPYSKKIGLKIISTNYWSTSGNTFSNGNYLGTSNNRGLPIVINGKKQVYFDTLAGVNLYDRNASRILSIYKNNSAASRTGTVYNSRPDSTNSSKSGHIFIADGLNTSPAAGTYYSTVAIQQGSLSTSGTGIASSLLVQPQTIIQSSGSGYISGVTINSGNTIGGGALYFRGLDIPNCGNNSNAYGIHQADAVGRNYFAASTQFGSTTTSTSAQVQINSTTKGFLPPVMTNAQKNAISSPATGLVVYDNGTNKLNYYNGSSWRGLDSSSGGSSYTAGRGLTLSSNIFRLDTANFSTLLNTSLNSTTTAKSIYNLTSTVPVNFKSSDGNSILYLDETNEFVGIGIIPTGKLDVNGAIRAAANYGFVVASFLSTLDRNYLNLYDGGDQTRLSGYNHDPGMSIGYGTSLTNPGGANTTFSLKGANTSSSGKALFIQNSASSNLFSVRNDGSVLIPQPPTASANYGLVSLGSGAFDGSTAGYFTGSANGTVLSSNITGSADFANWQKSGVSKFKVDNDGNTTTTSVRGTAVTFANRPSTPVEGMMLGITDSTTDTWGATITGGGSLHVLAYYNGTNWTVFGK